MENHQIIKDALARNPSVIYDRQKLRSLLLDYFPTNRIVVNTFLMAYDEGIISQIQRMKLVDEHAFSRFLATLSTNYGLTEEAAQNLICLVANVYNVSFVEPVNQPPIAPKIEYQPFNVPKSNPIKPTYAAPASDFLYASNGSEIQINKYIGNAAKVVIPNKIDGLPVTRIGAKAFYKCDTITEIKLPNKLNYIGEDAFNHLKNLTGVLQIPASVKKIGNYAFQSTSITGIVIYSDCKIELNALCNLYELEFFYVAKGANVQIMHAATGYADKLKEVILPAGGRIDKENFDQCNFMTMFTPQDSHAFHYAQKNFIRVDSDHYEERVRYYESIYPK